MSAEQEILAFNPSSI